MILTEQNTESAHVITESANGGKKLYLKGVFMEAEKKNRNGRVYTLEEMATEVARFKDQFQSGDYMLGCLDHPSGSLDISLQHVSHKITELMMVGNQAMGKAEVLEKTQCGAILKGLVESDVRVGFSSRGSGQVDNAGKVRGFKLVTIDAVAIPSAQNAYPVPIMESLDRYRRGEIVNDLAEAVIHDQKAQQYFAIEMMKFIQSLKL